ncbi:hypothetical protein LCGC14_2273440, partial [marine sediment metagenome]
DLVEYGITTSKADYWVHVVPPAKAIYVYKRTAMLGSIKRNMNKFEQREIVSARGWIVPKTMKFIRKVGLPAAWFVDWTTVNKESDHAVGEYCEHVCFDACEQGYFPFRVEVEYIDDLSEQYEGCDLRARINPIRIEVKADVKAADTPNLFVQTHEGGHDHAGRNAHRAIQAEVVA